MRSPVASIGVDAGGTALRITAVDRRGRACLKLACPAPPLAGLPRSLRATLREHALEGSPVLVLGSRGIWLAEERAALREKLRSLALEVFVFSDVELAHSLYFREGSGVLVIAGTGSIAYGRHEGAVARAGGLGPRAGDEGSGYWIGKRFLAETGAPAPSRRVAEIAAIAPRAIREAERRRPVALRIVEDAARHLAALALRVTRRLGAERPLPIALHGGLFRSDFFRRRCVARLRREVPGVRFRAAPPGEDAADRAAILGLEGSFASYRAAANPPR